MLQTEPTAAPEATVFATRGPHELRLLSDLAQRAPAEQRRRG